MECKLTEKSFRIIHLGPIANKNTVAEPRCQEDKLD